jgi:hypothetical protein
MMKLRFFVPRLSRVLVAAAMTCSTLMTLPCAASPAAAWGVGRALNPQPLPPGRALNPQPLPPGLYSPYRSGPINQMRAPLNIHSSSRRVCVAWGRVCIKAGQGTKTHPAPCEQYQSVCEKYA